jgi:hypothetical protein
MSNKDILFDLLEEEEFDWTPSGSNCDPADDVHLLCPMCFEKNGNHAIDCPEAETSIWE